MLNENISASSRKIVEKFLSGASILSNNKEKLVVSLYATSSNAKPEVLDILKSYLIDLSNSFSESDLLILKKESLGVIRYCHERKEPDMGFIRVGDNHPLSIPSTLLELCDKVLEVEPGCDIFLPYTGSAQFAFMQPDCKYEGFEVHPETWAFSQIYLQAYGISAGIELSGDMGNALPEGKRYDYVFSFPPFLAGRDGRTVIDNLYYLATKSLKENGTMCCILPLSFCTASSGWFDLRKILLDYRNEYSAAVISLPRMLYPYTSVETCMFILHRDGQGKVLLVDATSEQFCSRYDVAGDKEFVLKPQSILETIIGEHPDERYVWGGLTSDLIGDVNLLPARYLIKQHLPQIKRGEELIPLRDLIEVVDTERNSFEEECPLLGTKELSTSYLNCDISHDSIPLKPNHGFRMLTKNCLLAGFIGGKFKVGRTIDLTSSAGVALRQEIIPFKLKSTVVTEDFVLRSIMSDNVAQQGKMMATGVTIQRIKKQDFLDLLIVVPSLEEQERICKADTKQSLSDADAKQKKTDDDFRRDMHMKKHAIGQTIFNLNNWWKTLLRARKEGNGIIDDHDVIGNTHKVAVKDIFDNIQQTIDQLQQQISKFDRGNGLVTENISLTTFIEEYISKHESPIFKFVYDAATHHHSMPVDLEEVYDEKGNIIGMTGGREMNDVTVEQANFAPEALTIIFDNIVSNACSHGFAGREEESDRNIIKIDLSTEGTDHIITISNNGNPVREDVNEDYVFTYNKSTKNGKNHYGIGGYEVKRLMQEFDGDAEFISQPDDKFSVIYKLIFHNTGIIHIDFDSEE
jgi:hypothetical protein